MATVPSATREPVAIRLYESELGEPCARFVRRMWPSAGTAGGEAGPPPVDPRAPRVLFVKGTEVIGHLATLPVRLAVGRDIREAHWVVGLMVVPEHRNGPVAPLLVKRMGEAIGLGLTLHVDEAASRVFEGVSWQRVGVIPQYVRILNGRAFGRTFVETGRGFVPERWAWTWPLVTRFAGGLALAGAGLLAGRAAVTGLTRRGRPRRRVVPEHAFDGSYTALAERVKGKFGVCVVRDEAYLNARYGRRLAEYRLLACRDAGQLLGYCLVKVKQFESDPRMGSLRMGTIVDCLFDPDDADVPDALVRAAVAQCREERVDVVFCSASHRAMRRPLARNGFIAMRGTLRVAYHDRTRGAGVGRGRSLDSWHLMRGDSDADANC